jgi:hypothetical protein
MSDDDRVQPDRLYQFLHWLNEGNEEWDESSEEIDFPAKLWKLLNQFYEDEVWDDERRR